MYYIYIYREVLIILIFSLLIEFFFTTLKYFLNLCITNLYDFHFIFYLLYDFIFVPFKISNAGGISPIRTVVVVVIDRIAFKMNYCKSILHYFEGVLNAVSASPSAFDDDDDDFKQPGTFRTPGNTKQVDV